MEISPIIELFLSLGAAFYILVHFGLGAGLRRLKNQGNKEHPFVSVIVAARNEEKNIGSLLQCLIDQTYSPYEIIIINDRSTDNTARVIAEYQATCSLISRIDIPHLRDTMPAKKNALRAGIEASNGEILFFTDADCLPPPRWIERLVKSFAPDVGLVAGYSPYQTPVQQIPPTGYFQKVFFRFIAYEEFRAAIWTGGSIGWNAGWLCTGRNLAYRRKVYDEVNGFEKIKMSISGDDDLFLQLVRRETAWKIQYAVSPDCFVATAPPGDVLSFIEQRKRHFSAAKFFPVSLKLFFFFYHSVNLLLFISPLLLLITRITPLFAIVCLCSKLFADVFLFESSRRTFEGYSFRRSFIFLEVLYILYNSVIGPLGIFRKFSWKQN